MKKAQISLEFVFAIGLILLIFLALLYFSFAKRAEVRLAEEILSDKEECNKLSNLLTMAFITESDRTFELGKNATISIKSQTVSAGGSDYPCTLPINRISNASGDVIELEPGTVSISFADGMLEVLNA